MDCQNEDGSWYYFLFDDKRPSKIDNYHTGYILESLALQKKYLGQSFKYDKEFKMGIKYYTEYLFEDLEIPKLTAEKKFPIDIQSCAQSIITFANLGLVFGEYNRIAKNILVYTLSHFYDKNGFFYYRIYKNGRIDKTPYIRWGDSWMFLALTTMLENK